MTDEKEKDLTDLQSYSRKQRATGSIQTGDSATQAKDRENFPTYDDSADKKVTEFESLEQFSHSGESTRESTKIEHSFEETPQASLQISTESPEEFQSSTGHSITVPVLDETEADDSHHFAPPPVEIPGDTLSRVKEFSEQIVVGKPVVQAATPFSLLITGQLDAHEKEKLIDLLGRHNMGVREVDLEHQFSAGKILIPRISEYAGILLVQALRGTQAMIELGPSDSIFSTDDTSSIKDPQISDEAFQSRDQSATFANDSSLSHPAEDLPVTTGLQLPQFPGASIIDTVNASALLKTTAVEAESSAEYQEILEALQRELKYKAFRKGGIGLTHFKVSIHGLSQPSLYRISVTGSAMRKG